MAFSVAALSAMARRPKSLKELPQGLLILKSLASNFQIRRL